MVKVHINNTKHITIANIYIPPRDTTSTHYKTADTDIQHYIQYITDIPHSVIIGDVNAHSTLWHSYTDDHTGQLIAPNDTAYKRWSCHSGFKLLCKLCRTSTPPAMGARFTVFWACRPCGPAGWLALLLTKAGDVETNPGPTTLNKKVWICDICHKQIHVRKQISIRCNRIEHWVHLRCAGIRQAQYTDTWTCHLHR